MLLLSSFTFVVGPQADDDDAGDEDAGGDNEDEDDDCDGDYGNVMMMLS